MMDYDELRERWARMTPAEQEAAKEKGVQAEVKRVYDVATSPKWAAVMRALSDLYEHYYSTSPAVEVIRLDVEAALGRLMGAYNVWLG